MKVRLLLLIALFLSFCSNPMSTPEKTLKNYLKKLFSDKVFAPKYWDLNEFCKIYYGKVWDKASENDKKEQIAIIEQVANRIVNSHKDLFSKIIVKEIKEIDKKDDIARYRVSFNIEGLEIKSDSYTDFVLKKVGNDWKIINYERIKYSDKEIETSQLFSTNFNIIMQTLGFKSFDDIELKVINEYMKNSFNLK